LAGFWRKAVGLKFYQETWFRLEDESQEAGGSLQIGLK
jgi:hypothetical protein